MLPGATLDPAVLGQTFAKRWPPASTAVRTVDSMANRLSPRRTTLVTAGGIAAVIVAGAFAVGANMGILNASSDHEIGALAAAGDLVPAAAGPQTFLVDVAGTVEVESTGDAMTVSTVVANPGWSWTPGPTDATHVGVTFASGARTLVFTAARAADGSINATVDEVTPTAVASEPASDDGREDDEDEDHDEEREEEHEGRDDDD